MKVEKPQSLLNILESTENNALYNFIFLHYLLKLLKNNLISLIKRQFSNICCSLLFPLKMATLRKKRKLAALNKENCGERPWSNMAQNSNVPRSRKDYITQLSEKNEGKLTKKLLQEFSRTRSRILGALSHLDDFLLHPLIQGHSGTASETSWNTQGTNQGTNEDDSQSDRHPESTVSQSQATQKSGPDDTYDIQKACSIRRRCV